MIEESYRKRATYDVAPRDELEAGDIFELDASEVQFVFVSSRLHLLLNGIIVQAQIIEHIQRFFQPLNFSQPPPSRHDADFPKNNVLDHGDSEEVGKALKAWMLKKARYTR